MGASIVPKLAKDTMVRGGASPQHVLSDVSVGSKADLTAPRPTSAILRKQTSMAAIGMSGFAKSGRQRIQKGRGCPLYARKQTLPSRLSMSDLCQARKSAALFDHLVGAGEQCRWYGEAKGFCRLQIDD